MNKIEINVYLPSTSTTAPSSEGASVVPTKMKASKERDQSCKYRQTTSVERYRRYYPPADPSKLKSSIIIVLAEAE